MNTQLGPQSVVSNIWVQFGLTGDSGSSLDRTRGEVYLVTAFSGWMELGSIFALHVNFQQKRTAVRWLCA